MTNAEKREAFLDGASFVTGFLSESFGQTPDQPDIEDAATRRYPDPKEPTVVTELRGGQYRIVAGVVQFRPSANNDWRPTGNTPSDLLALGEIAQEYIDSQSPSLSSDTGVQ